MSTKRRRRHSPEQVVKKVRDANAMLNAGPELAAIRINTSSHVAGKFGRKKL